jgi:CheY-like chemotaxis protein/anti-sigma regulatory factor (Ser/Thr protein kinase)
MPTSSVLIVEDDQAARSGLAQLVAGAGFEVATAANGHDALAALDRQRPDLMLLDVWMPKMDGLELLSRMRTREPRPKVIVMTADDTPETVLLTLRRDAHQFVSKPIEPASLLRMLRTTLDEPRTTPSIVVLSARPGWVEVLTPCTQSCANHVEAVIGALENDLSDDVRRAVGTAFRELLQDAMEGDGHLDSHRRVRISCLRGHRMLIYRIADAGYGFRAEDRPAAGLAPTAPSRPAGGSLQHLLRPGLLIARQLADEVLVNEGRDEVVFIKYLE